MKWLAPLVFLFLASCKFLDFGGDDKKAFEFRFFWDRAPAIGAEDPENPGFDKDGNKIPSPEVYATYYFPDVTAGLHVTIGTDPRLTPTVGIEFFEAKLWKLRWFSGQIFAGDQLVGFGFYKRLTSIYEITVGPFVGYDLDEHDWTWGCGGTLLRF